MQIIFASKIKDFSLLELGFVFTLLKHFGILPLSGRM